MAIIWSDGYISQLIADAENDIVNREAINIFNRFSLSVVNGTSIYTLPVNVKRILFITWKGKPLIPLTQKEVSQLDFNYRTNKNTPLFYTREADGFYTIRFYPVPNETVAADDTNIYGSDISNRVIVSAFISPNTSALTLVIPSYIGRRLIKDYVLNRAFLAETDGQNLKASDFYNKKYQRGAALAKEITQSLYRSKENIPGLYLWLGRPARPVLPPNFGTFVD